MRVPKGTRSPVGLRSQEKESQEKVGMIKKEEDIKDRAKEEKVQKADVTSAEVTISPEIVRSGTHGREKAKVKTGIM